MLFLYMAKSKKLLFYFIVIGVFGLGTWLILKQGDSLQSFKILHEKAFHASDSISNGYGAVDYFQEITKHRAEPLAILLMQIIAIILTSRLFGFVFKKIHQPIVIGEILAGIVLGPSLMGHFFPEASHFLFPVNSLGNLQLLSQVGLVLFMFVIGMELDMKFLKTKAQEAVMISHASIALPFFLGVGLSYFIYERYTPPNIPFVPFALFMGIAMSITAFPVLARIVQERGLTKTTLGTMAITCAAIGDVTAWCILAAVITVVKAGTLTGALFTMGLSILYVLAMTYVIKPIMEKAGSIYTSKENLSKSIVAAVFLLLLASAFTTELIGIHALFGAFAAGVIMPQNMQFKKILTEKLEDISVVLLLPLFFVSTGLRTEIGLLNNTNLWGLCGIVIAIATIGKVAGSTIPARMLGNTWKNSLSLGALMNTRGLMELIVLNIGYDLGILSPEMFAIMVIVALVTTFMTGPSLALIDAIFKDPNQANRTAAGDVHFYKILMSFGRPQMGSSLLKLAHLLGKDEDKKTLYTAMHITPSTEIHPSEAIMYEREAFQPVKMMASTIGIEVKTKYRATELVGKEIINAANNGKYDLLLVGAARSVFNENILGGKIRGILDGADCNVGIFSDRSLTQLNKILVMVYSASDHLLIAYTEKILRNNPVAQVTILDVNDLKGHQPQLFQLPDFGPRVTISNHKLIDKTFLDGFDLAIVSIGYWQQLVEVRSQWIQHAPSLLIIKGAQ